MIENTQASSQLDADEQFEPVAWVHGDGDFRVLSQEAMNRILQDAEPGEWVLFHDHPDIRAENQVAARSVESGDESHPRYEDFAPVFKLF